MLDLGQARHGGGQDVRAGAPGNVVDEQRQLRGARHRRVVLDDALLGGLVVVGRDQQRPVGAGALGVSGELDGRRRVVGAGARHHRHAPAHGLHRDLDHGLVLGVRERGRLAGGAAGHEPVHTGFDLALDEIAQRLLVDVAVAEGGDECGQDSLEHLSPPAANSADPVEAGCGP